MRTLTLVAVALCLVVGVVHWTKAPRDATPLTLASRRSGAASGAAPAAEHPPLIDLVPTLATHCPHVALPGRRVVVTRTQPHVALLVHPAGEQISDALVTGGEWDGWGGAHLMDVVRNATGTASLPRPTLAPMTLPPSTVILDAGANIGALAVRWAAAGANVHAFEATAANADLLECSARVNGAAVAARLTLNRVALSHSVGDCVRVSTVASNMGMSSVDMGGTATADCVPTTTIDAYIAHRASTFANRFGLLKIDVEGHEPALLAGAQTVLASRALAPRAISLEVSVDRWRDRFGATPAEVLAMIVRHGYKAVFPPDAVGSFDVLVAFCEASAGGNPDVVLVRE